MLSERSGPSRRAVLGAAAFGSLAVAAGAGPASAAARHKAARPTEIPLPNGFAPEGISIGQQPYAYLASRVDGAVHRVDLSTGQGTTVHPGQTGASANGLKVDTDGLVYLTSGTAGGTAKVIDSADGRLLATYQLTDPTGHFINDVALVGDRAWYTDSYGPVLYGVPRGRKRGEVRALPLTGDWVQNTAAGTINANGIVGTPDESALIVVNGGRLYRVPVDTGEAAQITLSGTDALTYGDGLLRIGHTLYVVQNRANQVSVLDLDDKAGTATLTRTITDARLDVPTTAASYGDLLYLANARLTTPPTADTTYNVIAVPR
ncbi:superoxide dismutase [Streptomyces sp. NPDC056161]|uniref:superoxide dismutase n=1 Tax=Streptomyces sp. NPDC056161 TaxID=3345732 RepID=UPI0035DF1114